ncbi:sulfate adenylyltransferase subunit 1 [Kineosphaera limosa]|uniref:sulfate adenylyltransferase n=1 Tax=Kineosphaera limosa NBRC 100340 TaxID=1184609 RepID=K6WTE7_9MICO|nr:GTP-binding protein [Kineosphaera limosa]NYE00333.1 sulfate adenylyltransferase subunit 1 [Kineosphaera limosa]GAB97131.1 sulfate adenylyltransferase subunit 1 [Kineosphaera limosa NBRC 100340]
MSLTPTVSTAGPVGVDDAAANRRELRLVVAGSVDDGKSTLVGRLLYDTKSILADQYEAIEDASRRRGSDEVDLALLTDGLRAEREQGITIDVAYRYFSTPRRSFVLADTPGHTQYTRNTVTGASTAQAALVLVDVRNGVSVQTRRHLAVMALLRVPHVIVAVNKMDAIGWDEARFAAVAADVAQVGESLGLRDLRIAAVSALTGEGVVQPGPAWSAHPPLLELLENLTENADERPLRLPVQLVIRPRTPEHPDYRGLAGRVADGTIAVGDEIVVTPGGLRSTVTGIDTPWGPVDRAVAGESVTVLLADELDVGRGQVLSHAKALPQEVREIEGTVCWLAQGHGVVGARVLARVGTSTVRAIVREVGAHWDLDESAWVSHGRPIELNDIARVTVQLAEPVAVDDYVRLRETGAFILIDPNTGGTLAAGMAGPPAFGVLPDDVEDDEWLSP